MRNISIVLAAACFAAAVAVPAQADLVQNGDFSANTGAGEIGTNTGVSDWYNAGPNGYNFLYTSVSDVENGAPGQYGNVGLWDQTNSGNGWNGMGANGNNNFVALDGDFQTQALDQNISGLVKGETYTISFDYAFAQQSGFTGATEQGLAVSLGDQSCTPLSYSLASEAFSGWSQDTCTITWDGNSDVLSFLASANIQLPPFALLDNVDINGVPEPGSLALMGGGLLGLLGFGAWRRRRVSSTAS